MSPESLYAFEQITERGIAASLRSLGAGNVYESQAAAEFAPVLARLVVEAAAFTPASEQLGWSRQRLPFRNHYKGVVTLHINSPRTGGAAYHQAMLGLVRRLFSGAAGGLRLPPYDVLSANESPGTVVYEKDGERDLSRLVYALEILIPSGLLDTAERDQIPAAPSP
jgi:hypothetical protein